MSRLSSSLLGQDLALDLGTMNTSAWVKGRGIVCREPSMVALQETRRHGRTVVAVGASAKAMLGRSPPDIKVVAPLREGIISDFEAAEALIRHVVQKARRRGLSGRPRMVIGVPYGTTDMEKRAVHDCAERSGAGRVSLVEEPLAAAIGAEISLEEPSGNLIVDIGGGITQITVTSMAGIVYCRTLRVGGCHMEDTLVETLRATHGLLIGPRTAEEIKIGLGSAFKGQDLYVMAVKGRDIAQGYPRAMDLGSEEVRRALEEPVKQIVGAVVATLERTPPELLSDIVERGIIVSGGTSLLRGMDEAIREATGIAVIQTEDPLSTVVYGLGRIIEEAPRFSFVLH